MMSSRLPSEEATQQALRHLFPASKVSSLCECGVESTLFDETERVLVVILVLMNLNTKIIRQLM
jgi:hypothetical protein